MVAWARERTTSGVFTTMVKKAYLERIATKVVWLAVQV